jgi:hypothetical protein
MLGFQPLPKQRWPKGVFAGVDGSSSVRAVALVIPHQLIEVTSLSLILRSRHRPTA